MKNKKTDLTFDDKYQAQRSAAMRYLEETEKELFEEYKNDPLGLIERLAIKTLFISTQYLPADKCIWAVDALIKIHELKERKNGGSQ